MGLFVYNNNNDGQKRKVMHELFVLIVNLLTVFVIGHLIGMLIGIHLKKNGVTDIWWW